MIYSDFENHTGVANLLNSILNDLFFSMMFHITIIFNVFYFLVWVDLQYSFIKALSNSILTTTVFTSNQQCQRFHPILPFSLPPPIKLSYMDQLFSSVSLATYFFLLVFLYILLMKQMSLSLFLSIWLTSLTIK